MCNDCIHFEVCAPAMRNDIYIRKHMLHEKSPKCKYFLDKSLYEEWSCTFGDTVYEVVFLKEKAGFIVKRKVVGFHIGELPKLRGKKREKYLIVYHEATHLLLFRSEHLQTA